MLPNVFTSTVKTRLLPLGTASCLKQNTFAMILNLQVEDQSRFSENKIYYAEKVAMLDACIKRFGPTKIKLSQEIPKDATFVILRAGKYSHH